MVSLKDTIGDYQVFLNEVLDQVTEEGFDLADFVQLDHICYRTVSLENYYVKKNELTTFAELLGETIVSERPISAFRLHDPIIHDRWRIDTIELPAPKVGSEYPEGLEHVEFVLYDNIKTFLSRYSHKQFDLKAADRGINPEVGLSLEKHSVKFHLLNLPTVIYLEHKLGITEV
ncbi:MAG: VOC family protein [Candidatus Andersenbacteria bacterium]